jgi:hypothetical protein
VETGVVFDVIDDERKFAFGNLPDNPLPQTLDHLGFFRVAHAFGSLQDEVFSIVAEDEDRSPAGAE